MFRKLILPLAAACMVLAACSEPAPTQPAVAEKPMPEGQKLMNTYCGTCHKVPEIATLDTTTWKYYVLVRMASYMGVFWDTRQYYDSLPAKWLEPGEGGERVLKAGIYPSKPIISRPDFEKIVAYILSQAPAKTHGPESANPVYKTLPLFDQVPLQFAEYQAFVTGVHIDPRRKKIYASLFKQDFVEMDAQGHITGRIANEAGKVFIQSESERLVVADIGDMYGADTPKGQLQVAKSFQDLRAGRTTLQLNHLQRPVHAAFADLDADGLEDMVLSEYGNQIGQITWRKNLGNGQWEEKVLFAEDGALGTRIHDFNGDGKPDILAACANADESIYLWINQGNGQFSRERLFQFDPTWGSTAIELVDWDGDGKMDILHANGDNADYPAIPKHHHGLRLYRNKGNLQFEEAFYLPMNGAYGTRVRDFDLDGDLDIAAVSFYPDYAARGSQEGFILFVNQGNGRFDSHTISQHSFARWMVMDAGDVDGDGDEDIVLGAFDAKTSEVPPATYQFWLDQNVPVLLLRNTTR